MISPDEKALVAALGDSPESTPAEDLSGIPQHFRPIARKHGRAMFEQVYTVGVGQHAMNILASGVGRNMEMFNAVLMAVEMMNKLSTLHVAAKGWSAAELAAVDADIRRAMDAKIIVPRGVIAGLDS